MNKTHKFLIGCLSVMAFVSPLQAEDTQQEELAQKESIANTLQPDMDLLQEKQAIALEEGDNIKDENLRNLEVMISEKQALLLESNQQADKLSEEIKKNEIESKRLEEKISAQDQEIEALNEKISLLSEG